jgi:pyrimidine-specific ribonucleoside hydrolase
MLADYAAHMPIPLILDVDTGVDDAFALMLAARHPDADLRAVTCVAGNAAVDQVVANTLQVLDAAGAPDVPVARGAARPLLEPARDAGHVHGRDGLGGFARPSDRRASALGAVELLRATLQRAIGDGEQVTVVPVAPLTNIALLLRTYPEVAPGIERIVLMGGSASGGNATAAAEFNVWHDPEAAAIVFAACGQLAIPVTMYGLDVFEQVTVDAAVAATLRETPDPAAQLAAGLIDHQLALFGDHGAKIGDAGAVCAAIDPGGLTTQALPVRVDTSAGPARGQTIVDRRTWAGDLDADPHQVPATVVDVALQVDSGRYAALWLSVFG